MRDLCNLIHMTANRETYFPDWSPARYARMWASWNCKEMLMCVYQVPA